MMNKLRQFLNRPVYTISFLIILFLLASTTVNASVRVAAAIGSQDNIDRSSERGAIPLLADSDDLVGLAAQNPVSNAEMDTTQTPVTSMEGAIAIFAIAIFSLLIGYGIGRRQT